MAFRTLKKDVQGCTSIYLYVQNVPLADDFNLFSQCSPLPLSVNCELEKTRLKLE